MAAIPYMNLYVADYLSDTAHLTTLEHGAYMLLLFNYWQRGEALPGDDRKLARIAHLTDAEWHDIRPSLVDFFVEQDGRWRHARVERELASFRTKAEKASNAGRASAQRRSNGRSTDVEQTFNHTDTDTDKPKDNPEAAQHGSPRDAALRLDENSLEGKLRTAADWWHNAPKLSLVQPIQALIDRGADLDLDVIPTVRAYAEQAGSRTSWKYFVGPITDAWKARIAAGSAAPTPLPAAKVVELQSRVYVRYGTDQGDAWIAHYRKSLDKPAPRDMRGGWYFDSEWPPGHAQHNPKSTTVCPSPGDSAGEGRRLTEETDDVAGGGSAEVVAGVSHTMKSSEPPQPITETQAGFLVSPPAQEAGASAPAPASDLPDVPDFLKRRKGRAA